MVLLVVAVRRRDSRGSRTLGSLIISEYLVKQQKNIPRARGASHLEPVHPQRWWLCWNWWLMCVDVSMCCRRKVGGRDGVDRGGCPER